MASNRNDSPESGKQGIFNAFGKAMDAAKGLFGRGREETLKERKEREARESVEAFERNLAQRRKKRKEVQAQAGDEDILRKLEQRKKQERVRLQRLKEETTRTAPRKRKASAAPGAQPKPAPRPVAAAAAPKPAAPEKSAPPDTTTKNEIYEALRQEDFDMATVFHQYNEFFVDPTAPVPLYVRQALVSVVRQIKDVSEMPFRRPLPAKRYFSLFLLHYRKTPYRLEDTLNLLRNVKKFCGRQSLLSDKAQAMMKIRSLSANMGKGDLARDRLRELGAVRLPPGPAYEVRYFKNLMDLNQHPDRLLRTAMRDSWKYAYKALHKAGIPRGFLLNLGAPNLINQLLKVLIADTAMKHNRFGVNNRGATLNLAQRRGEIVKYTGSALVEELGQDRVYNEKAAMTWLKSTASPGHNAIELIYHPHECAKLLEEDAFRKHIGGLFKSTMALSGVSDGYYMEGFNRELLRGVGVGKYFLKCAERNIRLVLCIEPEKEKGSIWFRTRLGRSEDVDREVRLELS